MKHPRKPSATDTLHFHWTCPLCHWSGEVALDSHFSNFHGRHLHVGEQLLDADIEPRHLYFLEVFSCPGCSCDEEFKYFLAEIHCIGNRWVAVQTFPASELMPALERV
jgi:hypothetical protein